MHPQACERRLDRQTMWKLLVIGLPMGLQFSITAIGRMILQSANNALGSAYVSAFTAGARIRMFAMCPFDAIAAGVATFCSQNYGAGNMNRIREGYGGRQHDRCGLWNYKRSMPDSFRQIFMPYFPSGYGNTNPGCGSTLSQTRRVYLLDTGTFECDPPHGAGTWRFRPGGVFRCHGTPRQRGYRAGICTDVRISCNLPCWPGGMVSGGLIHHSNMLFHNASGWKRTSGQVWTYGKSHTANMTDSQMLVYSTNNYKTMRTLRNLRTLQNGGFFFISCWSKALTEMHVFGVLSYPVSTDAGTGCGGQKNRRTWSRTSAFLNRRRGYSEGSCAGYRW